MDLNLLITTINRNSNNLSELIRILQSNEENTKNYIELVRNLPPSPINNTNVNNTFNQHMINQLRNEIQNSILNNMVHIVNVSFDDSDSQSVVSDEEDILLEQGSTFQEIQFSTIIEPINIVCYITHEPFLIDEIVILMNRCRHIFKKNPFYQWIRIGSHCPACRIRIIR